ncbi:MAG: COQ9 family protein [Alphaproteobacteria bacterium]|nr:COQ9 family protein [Alphaproteobacteria bacterium]
MNDDNLKKDLLYKALRYVPFQGWTQQSLKHAAKDLHIDDPKALRLFDDPIDKNMIIFFSHQADIRMIDEFITHDLSTMSIRNKVALAIKIRLQQNIQYQESIRRAVFIMMQPQNLMASMRCVYHTTNKIWYALKDKSTDYNFYTKRGLLGLVYISTLFYWLNDQSQGQHESWVFLERRIQEVLSIPKIIHNVKMLPAWVPSPRRFIRLWRKYDMN